MVFERPTKSGAQVIYVTIQPRQGAWLARPG
jgi:hypothetical protein